MQPATLRRIINYVWQGPRGLPRSLALEWRLIGIRWAGIFFVGPGVLIAGLPAEITHGAMAVLAIAAVYNLVVQYLIRRCPTLFTSGLVTVTGDSLLNVAMMLVAGGFDSPLYYLLFTVTIAAAMRYGYGPAAALALSFVFFDMVEDHFSARQAISGPFLFRSGFLFITAILAGYLREQAHRAEKALQSRLRQASLLNEATAMLGVSLELEPASRGVAAAASYLFGGSAVALALNAPADAEGQQLSVTAIHPADLQAPWREDLLALCQQRAAAASADQVRGGHGVELLRDGRRALVFDLTPAGHPTTSTAMAVVARGGTAPGIEDDLLESFVERTRLAIENALLYRSADRRNDLQRAYAELARAHDDLLSLDEMKTNFLANVSHELRTPLNSIRAFSELLLTYDDDPSVQKEFLEIINTESERLTRLINDVLDIAKIESGHMDWRIERLDVAALLGEAGRTFAVPIRERGLSFVLDAPPGLPALKGDRDRLQQVLANLLNNAMKFTTTGTIKLAARQVEGELLIEVSDTGVGIAPEDQGRIFEKFQQVGDTLTEKPGGTGLGLAICREIVAHHGGRIWVTSRPGEGSTFTCALPADVTDEATEGKLALVPAA